MLVSLYMLDANSSMAVELARSLSRPVVYTALHRLEIRNAFSLAVFRGHQTRVQAAAAWRNLEADLKALVIVPISIQWHAAFRRAAMIAEAETTVIGARSFDILHIACAEQIGSDEFLTFDQRQRQLATGLGLAVRP